MVGVAAKLGIQQEPGQALGVLALQLQALEGSGEAAPQVIDPHQPRAFALPVGHQHTHGGYVGPAFPARAPGRMFRFRQNRFSGS